jgi:hypothetical protein
MSDEPLDLVAFAVEVDRWLLTFVDGRGAAEKAVLDIQVSQILRRDDIRTLLEPALRDTPQDVFAIASRIILFLVPGTVSGTLPLSLDPPLVAALALRLLRPDAENDQWKQRMDRHVQRVARRRARRWHTVESCRPRGARNVGGYPRPSDSGLVDAMQRPKRWHCIACGWCCTEDYNDYRCGQCGTIRPFLGGAVTMTQCQACRHWNPVMARFCEWCGKTMV